MGTKLRFSKDEAAFDPNERAMSMAFDEACKFSIYPRPRPELEKSSRPE